MEENELLSFVRKAHFIWGPEPEIYGGSAGLYSYGPNGKLLKNKIENKLREVFISLDFWEVETPLIMPKIVWKASGHLDRFIDKIFVCSKCNSMYRADKLIEEKLKSDASAFTDRELLEIAKNKKLVCPKCNSKFLEEIRHFNLMMKTQLGFEDAYLRPETATTTYLPFKNYYDFFRKKIPFRVFQIGKAFRNEISPRQNVLRMREFTQAESQLFIFEEDEKKFELFNSIKKQKLPLWPETLQKSKKSVSIMTLDEAVKKKYIQNKAIAFSLFSAYKIAIETGIPEKRIRFRQHAKEEKAHYAKDAWDLEVNTKTYDWIEVIGSHDRGNYDLSQHAKASGQKLSAEGKTPNIIELAAGIDRILFCLLDNLYENEKVKDLDRTVLHLKPSIAPIQAAVFPLQSKDNLPEFAKKIHNDLKTIFPGFTIIYDESGSIGKRYRRMDEVGCPYCITIDYDTLKDDTVTVRNRDSMKQSRIKIDELDKFLKF